MVSRLLQGWTTYLICPPGELRCSVYVRETGKRPVTARVPAYMCSFPTSGFYARVALPSLVGKQAYSVSSSPSRYLHGVPLYVPRQSYLLAQLYPL